MSTNHEWTIDIWGELCLPSGGCGDPSHVAFRLAISDSSRGRIDLEEIDGMKREHIYDVQQLHPLVKDDGHK